MRVLKGKSVFGEIVTGQIYCFKKDDERIPKTFNPNTNEEIERFELAKKNAAREITKLYEKALCEIGEEDAAIFAIHKAILEDPDYNAAIYTMIRNVKVNAEYAVWVVATELAEEISGLAQEYIKERSADIMDVSDRIIKFLIGRVPDVMQTSGDVIVYARNLVPSQTLELDRRKVNAFVTALGTVSSHTAILARTMGIPAVVGTGEGVDADDIDGHFGVVDGFTGEFYIDPDEETFTRLMQKKERESEKRRTLNSFSGLENISMCGRRLALLANICSVEEIKNALSNDAAGIGLFRSEFIYLGAGGFPDEEFQYNTYKTVLKAMTGRQVVIRTMDLGADKSVPGFDFGAEENPSLGYRAIRICLTHQDIFRTQLRALLRASVHGNLAIIFPMIISMNEIMQIKRILAEVREELRSGGYAFSESVPIGIMIETPAAVMISDQLAGEADFFSIGSNDLTQYTLAVDRYNAMLDGLYDTHHEGLLRMIKLAVDNIHRAGKPISICGELATDEELLKVFLAMGVDALSVPPDMILPLRRVLRATDISTCRCNLLRQYCISACPEAVFPE
ncbi:MAG: phosphoenolpyruvate--protein phosphotransferase [Oscillospiraceae bacterium]